MKSFDFRGIGLRSGLITALLLLLCASVAHAAFTVTIDRSDGVYALGSPASFSITSSNSGNYSVSFLRDGLITTETATVYLSPTPTVIKKTLYKPGMLNIKIAGSTTPYAGAIWDPDHLTPGGGNPADFDSWWASQKAKLAAPYTPEVVYFADKGSYDVWHVKLPMPEGRPVQGYMSKPKGAAAHSMPAIGFTHGSGVRSSNVPVAFLASGTLPIIGFDFNAHGIDDGQATSYYTALDTGELKSYRTSGWTDRETVYFRLMYLRACRAMDFLTKQPEWDGRTLGLWGNSQGGAQNIAVAALEPRVSVIVVGAPALSDLNGIFNNRIDGWPHTVGTSLPVNAAISNTALYYDCANFARRVKCDAFMSVGLLDTTCFPVTTIPVFNNFQSLRKKLYITPTFGHQQSLTGTPGNQAHYFVKDTFTNGMKTAAQFQPYE